MSRNTVTIAGAKHLIWLRIDTNKEFDDDVFDLLNRIKSSPKLGKNVRTLTRERAIITPQVFDVIQAKLDVTKACTCSLFLQPEGKHKIAPVVVDAPMYGKVKDDYDRILRIIRY